MRPVRIATEAFCCLQKIALPAKRPLWDLSNGHSRNSILKSKYYNALRFQISETSEGSIIDRWLISIMPQRKQGWIIKRHGALCLHGCCLNVVPLRESAGNDSPYTRESSWIALLCEELPTISCNLSLNISGQAGAAETHDYYSFQCPGNGPTNYLPRIQTSWLLTDIALLCGWGFSMSLRKKREKSKMQM